MNAAVWCRGLPALRATRKPKSNPRKAGIEMESCKHMNFEANVQVRIEDQGRFVAEIHIRCRDCGTPFQFMGLKPGFDFDGATVSLDGLEASIGIHPQGARPNPMQQLMGYSFKSTN